MFKNSKLLAVFTALAIFSNSFVGIQLNFTAFAETEKCNGSVEGYSCNEDNVNPYPGQDPVACFPPVDQNGFMYPINNYIQDRFIKMWKGHNNMNAGISEFNSHAQSGYYANDGQYLADLSIIFGPGATGLAPANPEIAACLNGKDLVFDDPANPLEQQTIPVDGYAWNTNLGFMSFSCNSGSGGNLGEDCGSYNYQTLLGAEDVENNGIDPDGTFRPVSGYGWNPTFGYISFR
ncbi:MAG: hypothetical protein WC269_05750, partial [Candidatus Gracilibacteria bacterium]